MLKKINKAAIIRKKQHRVDVEFARACILQMIAETREEYWRHAVALDELTVRVQNWKP